MLETARLSLLPCDETLLEAVLAGNNILSQVIGANVPRRWTENIHGFQFFSRKLKEDHSLEKWGVHLIVYRPENTLVGSCGYKGHPNEEGTVEIGYEIKAGFRERGLATEAANALVDYAFTFPEVQKVMAHTAAESNASGSVLTKIGFKKVGEHLDPDDGLVWRWELLR
ncbi:MAG: GNAT family N-acetyltransferase [Siphonobacter sp.]